MSQLLRSLEGRGSDLEDGWSFHRYGSRKGLPTEKTVGQLEGQSRETVRQLEGCSPGWPGFLVERSQAAHSRGNLGSLQLEVRLRDETVLPSGCYQPLVQLLCREVKLGTQVRRPRGNGCWEGPGAVH